MPFVNASAYVTNVSTSPIQIPATSLTAGNAIFAAVRFDPHASLPDTPTDTAGNGYSLLGTTENGDRFSVYYCLNCLGHASNVVSFTVSGGITFGWAGSIQWSGLGPLDAVVTNVAPSTGNIHAGYITPVGANEVAFIFVNQTGSGDQVFSVVDVSDTPTINERSDSTVIAIGDAQLTLAGVAHDFVSTGTVLQRQIIVALFGTGGSGVGTWLGRSSGGYRGRSRVLTSGMTPPASATVVVSGSTLQWNPVFGATGYVVEVGSATGLSNLLVTTTTSTSYSLAALGSGIRYARVRSIAANGGTGTANQGEASTELVMSW